MPVAEKRTIEGWHRLPGTARRYENTQTGEVLSDRQYRQRFLYPGRTLESVAKQRGAPLTRYTRLLHARQDYLAQHGIKANLREIRQSEAMKSIIRDLNRAKQRGGPLTRRERARLTPAERKRYDALYGPDSPLARALRDLGYRDPDARHYVGDS